MRLLRIAIASGIVLVGLFSSVMCDYGYGGYNYGGGYPMYSSWGYDGGSYYDGGYGKGGYYGGGGGGYYGGYGNGGGGYYGGYGKGGGGYYGGYGKGGGGHYGGYGKGGGGYQGGALNSPYAAYIPYGLNVPPIAPPPGLDGGGYFGRNSNSLLAVLGFGLLLWLLANNASNNLG